MTNEQLRLVLNLISRMVSHVAVDIAPLITDGERVKKRVWVGEGEPPLVDLGFDNKFWEYTDSDNFLAVEMVKELAYEISYMAESLEG